jgi:hypothetical protein
MPPPKTEERCGGVCDFRYARDTRNPRHPGIRELAQAGSAIVPPLVIATAWLLQVPDDSPVNIALPGIQDELPVTIAHLPWTVNAWEPRRRDTHPPEGLDGSAQVDGGAGRRTVAAGVPEGADGPFGRLFLKTLATVAESEANLGHLRTREGIAIAKRQDRQADLARPAGQENSH